MPSLPITRQPWLPRRAFRPMPPSRMSWTSPGNPTVPMAASSQGNERS